MKLNDLTEWDDLSLMELVEEANQQILLKLPLFEAAGLRVDPLLFVSGLNVMVIGYFQGLKQETAAYRLRSEGTLSEAGMKSLVLAAVDRRRHLLARLEELEAPVEFTLLMEQVGSRIRSLETEMEGLGKAEGPAVDKSAKADEYLSEGTDILLQVLELNRCIKAQIRNSLSNHRHRVEEG